MPEPEVKRLVDDSLQFSETLAENFGATLALQEIPLIPEHETMLASLVGVIDRENNFPAEDLRIAYKSEYHVIPAGVNIAKLQPGMGFGLMTEKGVVPALISPRSTPGQLHVLYLDNEAIAPQNIGRRGFEPNALQRSVLQGVNPFQAREVGGHAADSGASVASEGGHSLLGLKSLTSTAVRSSVLAGRHIVHEVAQEQTGIVPAFARSDPNDGPGMFAMQRRDLVPQERVVTATRSALLIDHPYYRAISVPVPELEAAPEHVIMGLGMMAAKDRLQKNDNDVRDELLTVLDKL